MLVGQQLGPFAIEKEIGSGAMGTVYLASYTKTGLKVAIKVIAPGLGGNANTLARFERETAILKKLNHPHIVRLYANGRVQGTPFYAMEYVEGESLEAILERRGRFSWEEVVALGQQICAALQHAHEQGVVHRDLKPANVMMTPDGTAKLTDFGIAKTLTLDPLTGTNCTVGTAAYMSPEQCRGERDLTAKSDLYSLGVLFYQLLTGRNPFPAETALDMFLRHTEGKFERPSRLVMDIPIWLDTLVCQLLEKKPEQRPLDAATVAEALNRVAEKVAAQRSAGVDMVSARVVDLSRLVHKPDDTDMAAARTLRAAVTKKRYKRRVRRFYERLWFQAVAISALLLAVGGTVYWTTRPPSADQLFAPAQKLMQSNNPDDQARAREGPITQYLKYYADRQDDQAAQVRRWADEVDVTTLEHQLKNRMKMKLSAEAGAESRAQAALRHEEAGDVAAAREQWQSLEPYKTDKNPEQRPWGLLAVRRLHELRGVDDKEKQLRQQAEQARATGQEVKSQSGVERLAVRAERYEEFGDSSMALGLWQNVKEGCQDDEKQRALCLLSVKKVKELTGREKRTRANLIREKLKQATEVAPTKPVEARSICQEIVVLYDTVPELTQEVGQARDLLRRLPAAPPP